LIEEVDPCGMRNYEQVGLFPFLFFVPIFRPFAGEIKFELGIWEDEKKMHAFNDFKRWELKI